MAGEDPASSSCKPRVCFQLLENPPVPPLLGLPQQVLRAAAVPGTKRQQQPTREPSVPKVPRLGSAERDWKNGNNTAFAPPYSHTLDLHTHVV